MTSPAGNAAGSVKFGANSGHNVGSGPPYQGKHAGPMRHLHHATASIMADSKQVCIQSNESYCTPDGVAHAQ